MLLFRCRCFLSCDCTMACALCYSGLGLDETWQKVPILFLSSIFWIPGWPLRVFQHQVLFQRFPCHHGWHFLCSSSSLLCGSLTSLSSTVFLEFLFCCSEYWRCSHNAYFHFLSLPVWVECSFNISLPYYGCLKSRKSAVFVCFLVRANDVHKVWMMWFLFLPVFNKTIVDSGDHVKNFFLSIHFISVAQLTTDLWSCHLIVTVLLKLNLPFQCWDLPPPSPRKSPLNVWWKMNDLRQCTCTIYNERELWISMQCICTRTGIMYYLKKL